MPWGNEEKIWHTMDSVSLHNSTLVLRISYPICECSKGSKVREITRRGHRQQQQGNDSVAAENTSSFRTNNACNYYYTRGIYILRVSYEVYIYNYKTKQGSRIISTASAVHTKTCLIILKYDKLQQYIKHIRMYV